MSRFRNVRRGRRPCPPKGSCEFAESFRKNRIFCGRTESSAPTDSLRFSRFRVGVDAHIDPAERTDFTITFGEFVIAKWGDVGIAPTSSLILKFYFWIEMRKLNSSVVSRKMPRNTFLCEISFLRPSRKNLVQVLNRWNTDIQKALNSKRGQLNFSHIQP